MWRLAAIHGLEPEYVATLAVQEWHPRYRIGVALRVPSVRDAGTRLDAGLDGGLT